MPDPSDRSDLLRALWLFETRGDGIYVLVEEIGGQGDLGPFADIATARRALVAYLRGEPFDEPRDPRAIDPPPSR